ncbi:MAG TPA: sulfotransferase [Gemmatimonadota bacterium]|nr:sulfotransferase [Gemmatimonadota bacterium]
MPTFLLIGAGRSGTTSVYHYLAQHPEIYMSPVKEPNFFAYEASALESAPDWADEYPIKTIEEYESLFVGVTGEKAIGEASPRYLRAPGAAERILQHLPGARIIAILRDPVERAFSAYFKYVGEGTETREFTAAIRDEERGIRRALPYGCHHYLDIGFYHRHLSRYYERFHPDQIQIHLYEDLKRSSIEVLRRIHQFVGVDERFVSDTRVRYNVSGIPKSRIFHAFTRGGPLTRRLRRRLPGWMIGSAYSGIMRRAAENVRKPALAAGLRAELVELYREDVSKLEDLIGRDLSCWSMKKARA